jgi:hypothetical protein
VKVTNEKETSAVAAETTNEGHVIEEALQLLLDQNAHLKAPALTEFVFHGPAEHLLQLMRAKRPDGLPADAAALVTWLKAPLNWKKVRDAQILVTFPPLPRREGVQMIKVERATAPDQYTRLVDSQRV